MGAFGGGLLVREKTKKWKEAVSPVEYCGKRFTGKDRLIGFLGGSAAGFLASMILFDHTVLRILAALAAGYVAQAVYLSKLVERRQKTFQSQFCDYLDSISTSLACGKNPYDSFLSADHDMRDLYPSGSPICVESGKLIDGLQNGRPIAELLSQMAEESKCPDVRTYGEIFAVANHAGGNLKRVTDDSRDKLLEKTAVENEIQTVLAGPKNELNIMALMPLVILAALRAMSGEYLPADSVSTLTNTISLLIFAGSYYAGRKIIEIHL